MAPPAETINSTCHVMSTDGVKQETKDLEFHDEESRKEMIDQENCDTDGSDTCPDQSDKQTPCSAGNTVTVKDKCNDIQLLSTEYSDSAKTEAEDSPMAFPVSVIPNVHMSDSVDTCIHTNVIIPPLMPKDRLETGEGKGGSVPTAILHGAKSSEKRKLKHITTKKVSSEFLICQIELSYFINSTSVLLQAIFLNILKEKKKKLIMPEELNSGVSSFRPLCL